MIPKTGSLFEKPALKSQPLAERLRPTSIKYVIGQDHLLGKGKSLQRFLEAKKLPSIILWGPPGCGKTTLAQLLAKEVGLYFEPISALVSGVADLRKAFDDAKERRMLGQNTLLFVDEIHRFSRSQQDVFLSSVEKGIITLVGATTENPSFELNSALMSRCRVLVLHRLGDSALEQLLVKAEALEGKKIPLTNEARQMLISMADGDGRTMLNFAESLFLYPLEPLLDAAQLVEAVQRRAPLYDKVQEGHYNLISALHKSVRGSNPQAAFYWFCRMIDAGENPMFIARRLVRMAVEDIGLADPQALVQTISAQQAYSFLGSPEGELALAQAVAYLAMAPKSNAVYMGYKKAMKVAKEKGSLPPPKHILNAPTKLMELLDYGKDYIYDHNTEEGFSGQNYFPDGMPPEVFYEPKGRGQEEYIVKRLKELEELRNSRTSTQT